MVILDEYTNELHKVYAIGNFNNVKFYWTEKGHFSSDSDTIVEFSEFVNKNTFEYGGYKYESEDEKIDGWYLVKELGNDFKDQDERERFQQIKNEIKEILPMIYQKIEIDYIQWKVKNGKIEEWQNNFVDKIIELSDTKRFIDDDNYDIFYDINDLNNIKVVKKRNLVLLIIQKH